MLITITIDSTLDTSQASLLEVAEVLMKSKPFALEGDEIHETFGTSFTVKIDRYHPLSETDRELIRAYIDKNIDTYRREVGSGYRKTLVEDLVSDIPSLSKPESTDLRYIAGSYSYAYMDGEIKAKN